MATKAESAAAVASAPVLVESPRGGSAPLGGVLHAMQTSRVRAATIRIESAFVGLICQILERCSAAPAVANRQRHGTRTNPSGATTTNVYIGRILGLGAHVVKGRVEHFRTGAAVHHQRHDSEVAMRRAPLLPALVVALIVGCDGGAPVEPTRPVHVTSVDTLRPGQIAHVRGSGLTNLRSLLLDGVGATDLAARSDSVAEFRVPSMRACETDMRAVKVSADSSAPFGAVVRVPPSVSLRPAESRVLREDDLRCLRLPAADEDYVLSAANLAIPTAAMESQRMLVSVRLLGTGDATASTLASSDARGPLAPFSARGAGTPVEPAMPELAALTGNYSQAPVPFDPRYATAVAGDTLRFVDWFSKRPQICHQPADSVPSFQAKVVAVSGQVAVVVDLRHPSAAAYLDPAKLGWLRDAAAMTDRLLLPTMRSIFDADYRPPAGGGGRFYVLLGSLQNGAGFAYDGPLPTVNVASQASCPRASEMVVSLVSADQLAQPQNQNASSVARVFLHEYAHNADLLTSRRDRTQSILNEGLATLAEETASRIASGQPLGARHSRVGSDAPAISSYGAMVGMWGTQPERIKDLQRAVDVLRARANVDDERIAYLGISYGGAMGALFVGIERRIKPAVLVVGDGGLVSHSTGPEDFNLMAGLSCATRVNWFRAMAPIEPIRFIPHASPTGLLLQSGRMDNLVPTADAEALHAAAPEPKTIRWYDAGHGLNPQAVWDRHDWLHEQIGLDARQ